MAPPATPNRRRLPSSVAGVAAGHEVAGRVLLAAAMPRAVGTLPLVDEPDTTTDVAPDRPWDVIVWDDPVNLMSYVVWVFMRVFSFSEPVARKLMLEVHHEGRSLVASEPREKAEFHLQQLHGHGLHATIQRAA